MRLCREVGYFGVFEIEFLREDGRNMVIDFNPRFYGQMGFEDARGLPLAFLAWLGAVGDEAGLHASLDEAAWCVDEGAAVFTHRFVFQLLLLAQSLGGSISAEERARWKQWLSEHRNRMVDASADANDPWPAVAHAASELVNGFRSIRRVFRKHPRVQADSKPVASPPLVCGSTT